MLLDQLKARRRFSATKRVGTNKKTTARVFFETVKRVATIILPRRDCDRKRGRDTRIIIYFLIGSLFSIETLNKHHFFFPSFFCLLLLGKEKERAPVCGVGFPLEEEEEPREKAEFARRFFSLSLFLSLFYSRARVCAWEEREGGERDIVMSVAARTRLRLIVVPKMMRRPSFLEKQNQDGSTSASVSGRETKEGDDESSTPEKNVFIHASTIREPNDARFDQAMKRILENEEKDVVKQFTPEFVNRLKEKASAYAHKTWQTWEKSEKGFGKKVYDFAQKLLEKIDPDEDVLKAIPSKALGTTLSSCEIVYPKSMMHTEEVRMAIRNFLKQGKKKARRAKYFNLACAPFTLPLFLSPVSNFPIYWFLYRAREAWIACKGAESAKKMLQRRLEQPELVSEDDREIQKLIDHHECTYNSNNDSKTNNNNNNNEACCRVAAHDESNCAVTFAPCDKLDEIFMSASSFISEDAKLNFWRRLTTVQLDSKENDDNFANNFVNVLGEIEKLTGAKDIKSLHKRYERFRALNAKS